VRTLLHGPWWTKLWPQKVRLRLTLLYAGLFLVAGSALLGVTYGLVAASLPARHAISGNLDPNQRAKLEQACRQPRPDVGTVRLCKEAFSAGGEDTRQQALHSLLLYSLLGLGVMTLASGGIGWLISGRVLRPVVTITETARRASEQHLGERLALTGAHDELKELADTFDDMLDRLDRAFGVQRRFVANASHELRTPLTAMRTAIDVTLAKPGRTVAQLDAMAVRVRRSVDTAEALIDALLTLAISDQGTAASEFLDLSALAEDARELAGPRIGQLGLTVTAELEPAETAGDPQLLERLVWNLVDNAVTHNQPGGWIRLRTSHCDGSAVLRVANSGAVIPAADLPTLTEPFRRLAGRIGSRGGAGLGMSIAQSVCAAHGTTLEVRGQPDGGLDIRVALARTAG
jgi:signal transduction histidine kinase